MKRVHDAINTRKANSAQFCGVDETRVKNLDYKNWLDLKTHKVIEN